MSFELERLRAGVFALAGRGVFVGTSSWKYAGWRGMLYDMARYVYRSKFSEARFERRCLLEYAEVFSTVCVDAAYYKFPGRSYLQGLASQVPEDFLFGFKVTDAITLKRFPNLPRFGEKAGKPNPDFLNAELFATSFLAPCEEFRKQIGILMFEFSHFHATDYPRGREFVAALDQFLAAIPQGWPYGVEIRNKSFLHPEYFAVLEKHGVTHVFTSWEGMPPIDEQIVMPGSFTTADRVAARLLLRPGRGYAQAVEMFSPYAELRDPYPEVRQAGARLISAGARSPTQPKRTFVFVNNRLEGNALHTIQAMIELAQTTLPTS